MRACVCLGDGGEDGSEGGWARIMCQLGEDGAEGCRLGSVCVGWGAPSSHNPPLLVLYQFGSCEHVPHR